MFSRSNEHLPYTVTVNVNPANASDRIFCYEQAMDRDKHTWMLCEICEVIPGTVGRRGPLQVDSSTLRRNCFGRSKSTSFHRLIKTLLGEELAIEEPFANWKNSIRTDKVWIRRGRSPSRGHNRSNWSGPNARTVFHAPVQMMDRFFPVRIEHKTLDQHGPDHGPLRLNRSYSHFNFIESDKEINIREKVFKR